MRFDKHDAAILNALGYVQERVPEHWQDVGGPENGPKLEGHRAFQIYARPEDGEYVVIEDGIVVEIGTDPYAGQEVPY